MKQSEKMARIREFLERGYPPVATMAQIAINTDLSYRQVNSALLLHYRSELRGDPFTIEFRCIGSRYQNYYYSTKRCDPKADTK